MYQLRKKFSTMWNPGQREAHGADRGSSSAAVEDALDPQHHGHYVSNSNSSSSSDGAISRRGHRQVEATNAAAAAMATPRARARGSAAYTPATSHSSDRALYIRASVVRPSPPQLTASEMQQQQRQEQQQRTPRAAAQAGHHAVEEEAGAAAAAEEDSSPPRLLSLFHPWGTSDSRPPPGWSSAASVVTRPGTASASANPTLHCPRPETTTRQRGYVASTANASISFYPAAKVTPPFSTPTRTTITTGKARSGTLSGSAYNQGTRSSSATKRQRGDDLAGGRRGRGGRGGSSPVGAAAAGEEAEQGGGEGEDGIQWQGPQRRRRTCPADSMFVSPVALAKRSSNTASSGGGGGGGVPDRATGTARPGDRQHQHAQRQLVGQGVVEKTEEEEEEELELLRHESSVPPPLSRFLFRTGLMRALRGGRAAAKRAKSATKIRRTTRDLRAMIIRQTFHAAHPPPQEEERRGGEEETKEVAVAGGEGGAQEGRRGM